MIQLPVVSNLLLQILLYINVYISCSWTIAYGSYILVNLPRFYNYHGLCNIVAFVLGVLCEYWRIFAGYTGNLKDRLADFSVFFILSPLVQMPILFFLYLFFITTHVILKTITLVLFSCMLLELIVGIYAWQQLSKRQAELFHLKLPEMLQRHSQAVSVTNKAEVI